MPDWLVLDWGLILPFLAIGFAAQLVDGALGMAYGTISNTMLISAGVPPAAASATVHTVEVFTTGASGLSHLFHGNIDRALFARLVIPGVIGGVAGAYLLTNLDADVAKPFVLAYLACLGVYLLVRGLRYPPVEKPPRVIAPLGLVGGFLDAAGGGGWGPIVTSNLLVQGSNPRRTIGTVSAAEFFLTLSVSATFLATLGLAAFSQMATGLLAGGILAAPLGAWFAKRVSAKLLLILVGTVLTLTSIYGVWQALR